MKEFKYVINDPIGIHARPAGEIAKKVKEFESKVTIIKDGKEAAADRLMAVMALGVKKGEEVTVRVEGADEDRIRPFMETYFKENL